MTNDIAEIRDEIARLRVVCRYQQKAIYALISRLPASDDPDHDAIERIIKPGLAAIDTELWKEGRV